MRSELQEIIRIASPPPENVFDLQIRNKARRAKSSRLFLVTLAPKQRFRVFWKRNQAGTAAAEHASSQFQPILAIPEYTRALKELGHFLGGLLPFHNLRRPFFLPAYCILLTIYF